MTREQLTNRAIMQGIRHRFNRIAPYATAHNVYYLMLLIMGFAILLRPAATSIGLLATYASVTVSSEFYAMMFIISGAYGFNRKLGVVERIWLAAPFLLHTLLTWGAALLREDVAITAPVIYTAVCIWHLNQDS